MKSFRRFAHLSNLISNVNIVRTLFTEQPEESSPRQLIIRIEGQSLYANSGSSKCVRRVKFD